MASFIDNISIRNKVVFGLMLTLFISIGIGILEFNKIVQIQNNFESRKIFNKYQSDFLKLQNLYYRLEVSVVKLANSRVKEELIRQQNEYKSIDIQIKNIFEDLNGLSFSDVENVEYLELLNTFNDSILKYQTFYNDKIILAIQKMEEYVDFTFHPDKIAENYKRLLAEQQSIDYNFRYETQFMSQDEIIWELMNTYEKTVVSQEKFISSSLDEQENSLEKISYSIQELIDKDDVKLDNIKRTNTRTSIIVLVIGILFVVIVSLIISESIVKPLFETNVLVDKLAKGEIASEVEVNRADEIGIILESLNGLVNYLKNTTSFSKEISSGNFTYAFKAAGENDILGNTLLELKDSLITAKREEKRREVEDSRRRRTADGIAKFSDILRQNQNNLRELGKEIISELVKFIKANQGVIFNLVEDDDERYLKLLAAYAWNREKFLEKNVEIGEGLIGSVAQEKFTVYMTDVPEDYIEIKSGTGSANPKSILIVPLKIEDEVLGVIELASFQEFEQYEIKLVETIAENIASTLKSVRISAQSSELLEKFQIQAAEMKEQELAMKATIDELRSSEDQRKKKEEELLKSIRDMNELNKQIQYKDEQLKMEVDRLSRDNEKRIKQLEVQQRQSKEILELMFTGVIMIKVGGEIEFVNNATEEIFGYADMELLGINIDRIIEEPPDIGNKKLCEYLFDNLNKIKDSKGREFYIKLKSGKLKKVLLEIIVLESDIEENSRMVILVKDMDRFERKNEKTEEFVNKLVVNDFRSVMKLEFYEELLKKNNIIIPDYQLDKEEVIKWGPKFELGIAMIDNQHKKWIHFINQLYHGLIENKTNEDLVVVFKQLLDYTDYHFGFEEKYMNEFGFANFDNHHLSHEKFVSQLNEMFIDYIEGRVDTSYNLILFLKKWVTDHVILTDAKYVDLFRQHGIR